MSARSAARPETVWAVLEDVAGWTEWQAFTRIEREGSEPGAPTRPAAVGDLWVLHDRLSTVRIRVLEAVPNQRLVYESVSQGIWRDYRATVDLTPVPAGGTNIRWHATFTARVPGTGRLWEWVLDRMLRGITGRLARKATEQEQRTRG